MTIKLILLSGVAALGLVSCASHNPQSRIEKNAELFAQLPESQKELVSQGQIKRGMSKSAVYLAKGSPASKSSGEKNGKSFEKWNYNSMRPVVSHGFGGFLGRGYDYDRYGYGYGSRRRLGYGYSPSVRYVSGPSSYVIFNNDRVTEWQSSSR